MGKETVNFIHRGAQSLTKKTLETLTNYQAELFLICYILNRKYVSDICTIDEDVKYIESVLVIFVA